MKTLMRASLAAILAVTFSIALAKPPTAAAVLEQAQKEAKASHKNVLVMFHASWCGWCHKLDGFLEDPKMGAVMKSSYVIVHLDVLENGEKKSLENEGGLEYMAKFGGKDAGLPFSVVLDPKGKILSNSMMKDSGGKEANIGYPAQPSEIKAYIAMLKKTSPRMKANELKDIELWLTTNAPKG